MTDMTDEQRARAVELRNVFAKLIGAISASTMPQAQFRAWLAVEEHVLESHTCKNDVELDNTALQTAPRIWQSADIEVVGESPERIISEIRHRASSLFKKFTISQIKYRWAGTNAYCEPVWVGQATVTEEI